jgi:hypothetical protein
MTFGTTLLRIVKPLVSFRYKLFVQNSLNPKNPQQVTLDTPHKVIYVFATTTTTTKTTTIIIIINIVFF